MTASSYERELAQALEREGWIVIRSAGSMGHGDLVALRPDEALVIECKKTRDKAFYTGRRARTREQYHGLLRLRERGLRAYYAIRFVGERVWHFYPVRPGYPALKRGEAEWTLPVR